MLYVRLVKCLALRADSEMARPQRVGTWGTAWIRRTLQRAHRSKLARSWSGC